MTRDAFSQAVSEIQSNSFIICGEEIEDLVWERCPNLNTEIVSYERLFVFISGEETWSKEQLAALGQPASFIVDGTLTLTMTSPRKILRPRCPPWIFSAKSL